MASRIETNELEKQCTTQGAGVDTRSLCICVSTIICPAQMATEYLFFYGDSMVVFTDENQSAYIKHSKRH